MQQSALKISPKLKRRPLCVDLDYTLVRTDIFLELLLQFLVRKPWQVFSVVMWALKGKAQLKREITLRSNFDAALLPYNKKVVSFLEMQKARGRRLILVTGSDEKIAEKVAEELGLFAEFYGSDGKRNLLGFEKAKFLIEKFGEKKFAYLGDSDVDFPVWKASAEPMAVVYSKSRKNTLLKRFPEAKIFSHPAANLKTVVKAIRMHQWVKNILIFMPVVFAQRFFDLVMLEKAVLGFFSMCFMASSIYVLNDLMDVQSDRKHPNKRLRPFASGKLSIPFAVFLFPVLFATSLAFASPLNIEFKGVLLGYVCLTSLYSYWLKQVTIADVIVLATLFSGRLFAGSVLCDIQLSPWFIAFTSFLFLSLALVKRCSELLTLTDLKQNKMSGRGYIVSDTQFLISTGLASGFLAVLVLALYINSETAKSLYAHKDYLWLTVPIVLYWITRVWFITNRKGMHHDPVTFVVKDPLSLFLGVLAMLVWIIAH